MMDLESIEDFLLQPLYKQNWVIVGIYIVVIIIGLISNLLIIIIIVKIQALRNVTNYFLVNLAFSDLLVTFISMPNAAYNAYTGVYIFGEYPCKLSAYFQCVAVALSIFTITTMAIDRYLAITKPFDYNHRNFNKKIAIIVILLLWIFALIIFSPMLVVMETKRFFPEAITILEKNTTLLITAVMCTEDWSYLSSTYNMKGIWGTTWFIVMFVIPGFLIFFAYSIMSRILCLKTYVLEKAAGCLCNKQRNKIMRERRRAACILLLLAFVFAVCWLPYHVLALKDDLSSKSTDQKKSSKAPHWQMKEYLLLLGHVNSMLNPIIYSILSKKFRKSIVNIAIKGFSIFGCSHATPNEISNLIVS